MSTVLIVEDHPESAEMLQFMLSRDGHNCDIAANGAEALSMFEPSIHKVVLLDIQLPDMTGYEILETIRKTQDISSPTIVVAQTAKVTDNEEEHCLCMGFDDYISKPISYKLFHERLPKWLKAG